MEGIISQLVDEKVLKELEELNKRLEGSCKITEKMVAEVEKLEKSLIDVGSQKEFMQILEKYSKIEKELVKQHKEREKTLKDMSFVIDEVT